MGISLPGVHWIMWQRRNVETNEIVLPQKELAEDLAVRRARAGQVLTGLVAQGRITKVEGERSTYLVADPARFVDGS